MMEIWPCQASEVRDILAPLDAGKANPKSLSIDALCAAGQCFKMVDQDRQAVGAYVVQAFGDELWITAAAGAAENDLTAVMAAAVLHQGRLFDAIVFKTVRPGLMKKALAHGYTCTMRKQLK